MTRFDPDECSGLAIALITATQSNDYEQMAKLMNDLTLANVAAVIASLAGLSAAFLEHCATELQITPDALLHTLGIQNAIFPG